ncbi:hypothetical protein BHE74_00058938 [Ensete ventricosum]|nr:hypothetical protein BHE74_00058938 [Ensete ventricosum]
MAVLHAIGVRSRPCGKHCCPRAAPRGRSPCRSDRPCRRQPWPWGSPLRPCSGQPPPVPWPRALPMPASAAPTGANHARGRPRMLAATPVRGLGRNRSSRGWSALHGGWPWLATLAKGLAMADHPLSLLPLL